VWRSTVLRLAVIVVLLAAAGTVAVRFMYRPAQMQPVPPVVPSTAPAAGSPSPSASGPAGPSQEPSRAPSGLSPSGPTPLAGSRATARGYGSPKLTAEQTTIGPQDGQIAEAAQLCGVWSDPKTDRATRDRAAQRLRQLMAVLDGPNGMPAFCKDLLGAAKSDKKGT
jgi:hypothetical protein